MEKLYIIVYQAQRKTVIIYKIAEEKEEEWVTSLWWTWNDQENGRNDEKEVENIVNEQEQNFWQKKIKKLLKMIEMSMKYENWGGETKKIIMF